MTSINTALQPPLEGNDESSGDNTWLKLAQDAYQRSTGYFDANYRKTFEDNIRLFQSKHPKDSKYQSDAYKYRSRIFRPKSRSVLRKNEATAALAFFSNPDAVSVDPQSQDDPRQLASAAIMKELMQYRLTKTIPWFLTLIGGFQDAMTVGVVCSMQCWQYRCKKEKKKVPATIDLGNGEVMEVEIEQEVKRVIKDEPSVTLFPVENVLFDPAAHWYDPVGTSPYLILKIPMYINDVLDNMESEDDEGKKWKKLTKQTLLTARIKGLDPIRQARNDNREDPDAVTSDVNEFDVVMVHLNFIKSGDETHVFYSLEDKHLLSTPMLVQEMFLHCDDGRPPVQIGFCVIETHKSIPTSLIGLTSELQKEANEIANQRLDNVKYVLNKRSLVRRGANVDVDSLLRNVPGGVTMVNDVDKDIREVNWQDVTSSSYQEQDRVNVDFDELAGNFAQSSVQTNRKLNETVGGMKIMAQGANMLTEYTIRVLVETWIQPMLRQIAKMEQAYETDEVILAIAAQRAELFQKFGVDQLTDDLLNQELTLTVNVGMGATDPDQRLQRFMQATTMYGQLATEGPPDLELPEIRKTIYGLAGFRDGERFFKRKVDPQIEKAMQVAQGAEAEAQKIVDKAKDALTQRQIALDKREMELNLKEIEANGGGQAAVVEAERDFMLKQRDQLQKEGLRARDHQQKMALNRDKANEDAMLKRQASQLDARLKTFEASVLVSIKKMLGQVEADNKRKAAERASATAPAGAAE